MQNSAKQVEGMVRMKMEQREYIILCLEDTNDWSNATTRRLVMQVPHVQCPDAWLIHTGSHGPCSAQSTDTMCIIAATVPCLATKIAAETVGLNADCLHIWLCTCLLPLTETCETLVGQMQAQSQSASWNSMHALCSLSRVFT